MRNYISFIFIFLILFSINSINAKVVNKARVMTIATGDSVIDTIDVKNYNLTGSFAYSVLPIKKAGTISSADSLINYCWEMIDNQFYIGSTLFGSSVDSNNDSTVLYNRAVTTDSTLMPKQTLTSKPNSKGFLNIIKFLGDSGDTLYLQRNLEISFDE